MKIFLSYSTKDEKIVRSVSKLMPSEVFTWIDHKAISGGSILNNKIKKGIHESDIFFVFISQDSIDAKWVSKEINWAMEKEKKLKYDFIVPVVLNLEAWEKWENRTIKEKLFISTLHKDSYELANDIKDTILSKTIQKFKNECLIAHGKLFEIIGSTISGILIVIAFFTEPTKQEHIDYIQDNSKNCNINEIKYTDMTKLLNFTTCQTDKNEYFLTIGAFGKIFSKNMTE